MKERTRGPVITDLADTKGLTIAPNLLSSKELAANIKVKILEGDIDALTIFAFLKKTAKVVKILSEDKEVKDLLEKQHKELLPLLANKKVLGVTIYSSTSTKNDYSGCNHPEYEEIIDILKQLNNRKKQIEEQLQAITNPEGEEVIVKKIPKLDTESSGELAKVFAPVKISKPTIVFRT